MKSRAQSERKHFADSVPKELADKLQAIASIVHDDHIGAIGKGESLGRNTIDNILGVHVSGFIPYQNGGYSVSDLYQADIDPSYHLTAGMTDTLASMEKDMYDNFRQDHKELNLAEDYSYDDLPENLQNEFSDYENDYFEPALVEFQIWVTRDNSVYMRLSVNYRDAPYYREKYANDIYTLNMDMAEFMDTSEAKIIAEFMQGVNRILTIL